MKIWLAALTVALAMWGQSFEVASIKPHPGEVIISMDPMLRGNRVVGTASTLLDLITNAYGVRHDQVAGGPEWIKADRFDVEAKAPGDAVPSSEEVKLMMRNLLAERFGLKLHAEARDVPVYFLVVAKSGAKLKAADASAPVGAITRGSDKGIRMETKRDTMQKLALQLSVSSGRPVIDRTGLDGEYQYTLEWFPANRIPPADSDVPSVFTAVEEQLGLKLETGRAPQDFLVIDYAGKLSEN